MNHKTRSTHFLFFYRCLLISILIGLSSGCSTVKISGANAEITRSYIGLVNVKVSPTTVQPSIVTTEGIGITSSVRSTNLGWVKESLVFTNDLSTCKVYVVIERNEDLENLKNSLDKLENICIITKEGRVWPAKN